MVRIETGEGGGLTGVEADLLAVCVFENEDVSQELLGSTAEVLKDGDFSGKKGSSALVYNPELRSPRLLLVGLGTRSSFGLDTLRRAAATAAKRARSLKLDSAAFALPVGEGSAARVAAAEAAAEGAALGLYRFDRYKTKANGHELSTFTIVSDDEGVAKGAETGAKLAAATVLARDLQNEPSNTATPEFLAQRAREIAGRHGMDVTVLDSASIEAEGLNGLATV